MVKFVAIVSLLLINFTAVAFAQMPTDRAPPTDDQLSQANVARWQGEAQFWALRAERLQADLLRRESEWSAYSAPLWKEEKK